MNMNNERKKYNHNSFVYTEKDKAILILMASPKAIFYALKYEVQSQVQVERV